MKLDTKKIARYNYEDIQALIEADLRREGLISTTETVTLPQIDQSPRQLVYVEVIDCTPSEVTPA